jgi:fibrillarin-like pre-rRNA processing protein
MIKNDAYPVVLMKTLREGVYQIGNAFATLNADPGRRVYNERLVKKEGKEYRLWDAFRSKLCAAMKNGLRTFPFRKGGKVLYLGASTGTTISHLSDIMGDGEIYGVEISPQCMKSLFLLCERRENIIPIHGDARKPIEYEEVGTVEAIYQDVAQPDQDELLLQNARMFLKKGGIAMIAIKSQSIDVTKKPKEVFDAVIKKLEKEFDVLEKIKLEPFDKDHLFVVLKYRG